MGVAGCGTELVSAPGTAATCPAPPATPHGELGKGRPFDRRRGICHQHRKRSEQSPRERGRCLDIENNICMYIWGSKGTQVPE